jgi:hypothetical protein
MVILMKSSFSDEINSPKIGHHILAFGIDL